MRRFKNAVLIMLSISLSLLPLLPQTASAAQGASRLYLSPSSGVVAKGNTLAVEVYEDSSGDGVNNVQANLAYPSTLLNYISITSGAAFPVDTGSVGGNGTVNIGRASNTPQSGNQLVATVRFMAIADTGTATLTFAKTSSVTRASDNSMQKLTTLGASYTMTPAQSTPQSNTPPSQSSSVDITPTTISNLKVINIGLKSATIQWTTNVPATSEVDYGFDTNYLWQAIDNNLVRDHKLALDPQYLDQNQSYHFIAKSYDSAQTASISPDQSFRTLSPPPPKPSNTGTYLLIGFIVLLGLGVAGGAYYAYRRGIINFGKNKMPPPPPTTLPPNVTPPTEFNGPQNQG